MADLIERDALEPFYEIGTDPKNTYADMTFIRAEHIESAPAVNRWISCSERLPEDDAEVLAYSPNHGAIVILTQYFKMLNVTHWMPLPDVYEQPEKE